MFLVFQSMYMWDLSPYTYKLCECKTVRELSFKLWNDVLIHDIWHYMDKRVSYIYILNRSISPGTFVPKFDFMHQHRLLRE